MAAEPGGKESIYEYKDEIMTAIRDNKVVVITGNTGCGKVRNFMNHPEVAENIEILFMIHSHRQHKYQR